MDIMKFLDIAIDLETQISKIYEFVAERSGDPPIASRLKAIANEEINHANFIRQGKRYCEVCPDMFAGITMDENVARIGLEEAKIFYSLLRQENIPLLDRLKKLLDLEIRFERVHLTTSVTITESALKKLFTNLMTWDKSHILVLKGLIESFGENG